MSDRQRALFFWGLVIWVILIVAALVTHSKKLRLDLYTVLATPATADESSEGKWSEFGKRPSGGFPTSKSYDELSRCGTRVLFAFLFVSLGTVGTLIAITGGLTSSVFAFLLAGFVSVSATVSERALVPVVTSVFCITVAFASVLAPVVEFRTTSEVMALGRPCRDWMYFLMFSATLALAAGADIRRNRPLESS